MAVNKRRMRSRASEVINKLKRIPSAFSKRSEADEQLVEQIKNRKEVQMTPKKSQIDYSKKAVEAVKSLVRKKKK